MEKPQCIADLKMPEGKLCAYIKKYENGDWAVAASEGDLDAGRGLLVKQNPTEFSVCQELHGQTIIRPLTALELLSLLLSTLWRSCCSKF